jgi:hypothetical protein
LGGWLFLIFSFYFMLPKWLQPHWNGFCGFYLKIAIFVIWKVLVMWKNYMAQAVLWAMTGFYACLLNYLMEEWVFHAHCYHTGCLFLKRSTPSPLFGYRFLNGKGKAIPFRDLVFILLESSLRQWCSSGPLKRADGSCNTFFWMYKCSQ